MELKVELLEELLKGVKTQADLTGPNGLLKQITKALTERMLAGELTHRQVAPTVNRLLIWDASTLRASSQAAGLETVPNQFSPGSRLP